VKRRRILLWGGAAAGGAALWWVGSNPRGFTLGPPQLVPPLLRTRIGEEERLLVLTRRTEQEIPGPLALSAPELGERVELRGFAAADLRPLFVSPLVSQGRGQNPDMALLGEQAGTVWLHIGGIGAASTVDGRLLADSPGLREINPILQGRMPTARRAFEMDAAGLLVTATDGTRLRIDPRRFTASAGPATGTTSRPVPAVLGLPPARYPAPVWSTRSPPFRAAELNLGTRWLGLVRARHGDARSHLEMGTAMVRLEFSQQRTEPMRLWSGERTAPGAGVPGNAPAAPVSGAQAGQKQPLPSSASAVRQGAPAPSPSAAGGVERLSGLTPVEIAGAKEGLFDAGFLALPHASESVAFRFEDTLGASGLLLYRTAPATTAAPLRLARLDAAGRVLWDTALPIAEVSAVVPGASNLILAGPLPASGGARTAPSSVALIAVEPSRGAVAAFDLGAERPITL